MADLSEFLGNLVSSISESRVNSDLQSVRIAQQYAKDNLLQHFAVPRMRIENVELTIPIAIDSFQPKTENSTLEPINNSTFSSITYQEILKAISVDKLPSDISKEFKSQISDYIKLLEAKINVNQIENSLLEYAKSITEMTLNNLTLIYKQLNVKVISKNQISLIQKNLLQNLQDKLKNEIKLKQTNSSSPYSNVIVESSRLREMKPENIIMIKMKVTEQGMEWIKMENEKGEIVSKLMPE
ncbi:hypothetical protein [Flavobacterium sp.]|uniref:hypothetical protein n=1 Tax=Flavobacterium sp. TaxID=239 RepID=UPI00261D885E|nr:hypothetical protein [Flavobacterium sp.]MDG2433065.1 hypothetical protein [Flavobacterium sp.]